MRDETSEEMPTVAAAALLAIILSNQPEAAMLENLDRALAFVLLDEGGLRVDRREPGGASNMGVSMVAYAEWRHKHNKPAPTINDLAHMPAWQARELYMEDYATKIGFDSLPLGVDYAALDAAINEGVHASLELLAKTSKIVDAKERVNMMSELRLAAKKLRPEWARDGKGWTARIGVRVPQRAFEMIDRKTK